MTAVDSAGGDARELDGAPWWRDERLAAGLDFRGFLLGRASGEWPKYVGTFMARDALGLAGDALDLTVDDTVYLPAYLCKEVMRPFAGRSRIRFYDLERDLSIDPDHLASRLRENCIRLVVFINYFGRLQPHRRELRRLCEDQGALLLEDCAHSLLTEGSGETGHLTVVSYRKLLPVWDGGALSTRTGVSIGTHRFRKRLVSDALSLLVQAKSRLRIQSQALSRAGVADLQESLGETTVARPRPILPLARRTERQLARLSAGEIVARRRQDFEWWGGIVAGLDGVSPLVSTLEPGMCPLGFPVIADDRDRLLQLLRSRGVPATVHWRLSPAVGSDCRNSHAVSTKCLTLPVFPDLTPAARRQLDGPGRLTL